MKNKINILSAVFLALASCSQDNSLMDSGGQEEKMPINLSGEISQVMVTRANDSGFVEGDEMGVYVVNYEGDKPGKLLSRDNHADNINFTCEMSASGAKWTPAQTIYWKDKHTLVDIYGYYPVGNPDNVNEYSFTISQNQAKQYENGNMSEYEASDFLWGKVEGVAPTDMAIRLPMSHRMSNARVTLTEGEGFAEGEWASLSKQVLVTNTVRESVINLATGTVVSVGEADGKSITPFVSNDEWRAIVVPQTIKAGVQLFSITIDGTPYKFQKDEDIDYASGKMCNFTIKVDKTDKTGKYTLTLIGESITAWENDVVSHDGGARQYVVIDVPEGGGLRQAIADAGKDPQKILNLKLTGKINDVDFKYIKSEMSQIRALNMKEVKITKGLESSHVYGTQAGGSDIPNDEDVIPEFAFYDMMSLQNVVLPDRLKHVRRYAFSGCKNLSGSLILPEGLESVDLDSFSDCGFTGTLSLPSTLKVIGGFNAFRGTLFSGELKLPEGLTYVGVQAFEDCNFSGELHLPQSVRYLGSSAFARNNFTGSLEIPSKVTEIGNYCFQYNGFNGTLKLHNAITRIGGSAFYNNSFQGELILPSQLKSLGASAFNSNRFTSISKFPESLTFIESKTFAYNRFSGKLEIGKNVTSIAESAFYAQHNLEAIILPENLEYIGKDAFGSCYGIGSIVCKSETPPEVEEGAFEGVPKDNFILEVPESSIVQYQVARGWSEFKRIGAHHELICRPSMVCALSTERCQTIIIDAEGEWEVESKPEWCSLSQSTGITKAEMTLTIQSYSSQSGSREGDIVFRLKGKDYTTKCHVSQYGYQYAEDEFIPLQKASKGNNGGINIVILGDGYNAAEIASGKYLSDMQEMSGYFFEIEPYTTYRDYFNVYTAFPVSTESGVGTVSSIIYNKFNTTYYSDSNLSCDNEDVFEYVLGAPTVNSGNLNQTLVIIVPNGAEYGGNTVMSLSGAAISICPKSDNGYPADSRGIIRHEAGGHGFGKLADENVYINSFVTEMRKSEIESCKSRGWYDNIDINGRMNKVTWSHLIFDPRYSDIVDIFEGGYDYSRGVFRSEQNSCMNNYLPYFNTISRESIVRRIKQYAGETFDFEDFVSKDKRTGIEQTRSGVLLDGMTRYTRRSTPPTIINGTPQIKKNRK